MMCGDAFSPSRSSPPPYRFPLCLYASYRAPLGSLVAAFFIFALLHGVRKVGVGVRLRNGRGARHLRRRNEVREKTDLELQKRRNRVKQRARGNPQRVRKTIAVRDQMAKRGWGHNLLFFGRSSCAFHDKKSGMLYIFMLIEHSLHGNILIENHRGFYREGGQLSRTRV
jgi:hypothetical protein